VAKGRADRVAGHDDTLVETLDAGGGAFEGDGENVGEAEIDLRGETEDGGLLVGEDRRDAGTGDDGGDADETAGAEDDVRAELAEDAPGLDGADREADDIEEGLDRKVAAEFACLDGAERDTGTFGGWSFDITVTADPEEIEGESTAAEFFDDGEGGEDVAAGPTSRDNETHCRFDGHSTILEEAGSPLIVPRV
jgi:hypothetical protein